MSSKQLRQLLEQHEQFVLAGHVNPDGDALGALYALGSYLLNMDKEVILYLDGIPSLYRYLDWDRFYISTTIPHKESMVFIALDCGDEDRLGGAKEVLHEAFLTINIDHHCSNPQFGHYNFVDTNISSTCELLYQLLFIDPLRVDDKIAAALFTGIIYDTGAFMHPNTSGKTHLMAAALHEYHIDTNMMIRRIFHSRSYKASKLLSIALDQFTVDLKTYVGISTIDYTMTQKYQAEVQDLDGIINALHETEESKVTVFMYEIVENEIKVSLRSKTTCDVSAVAAVFGGGGHKKASGCTIFGSMEYAKNQISQKIQSLILEEKEKSF